MERMSVLVVGTATTGCGKAERVQVEPTSEGINGLATLRYTYDNSHDANVRHAEGGTATILKTYNNVLCHGILSTDSNIIMNNHTHAVPFTFDAGQISIAPDAVVAFDPQYMRLGLYKHLMAEWGQIDDEVRHSNERALQSMSGVIMSVHFVDKDHCFRITTTFQSTAGRLSAKTCVSIQ